MAGEESVVGKVEQLLIGVAEGKSIRQAAFDCGLSESTARRRAARPEFQRRLRRVREQFLDTAVQRLSMLSGHAALRLGKLIDSPDEKIALDACRHVLAAVLEMSQSRDLSARLEALEGRTYESPLSSIDIVRPEPE